MSTSRYGVSIEPVLDDGASTTTVAEELGQVRVGPVLSGLAEALPGSVASGAAALLGDLLDLRLQLVQAQVAATGRALLTAGAGYDACESSAAASMGGGTR